MELSFIHSIKRDFILLISDPLPLESSHLNGNVPFCKCYSGSKDVKQYGDGVKITDTTMPGCPALYLSPEDDDKENRFLGKVFNSLFEFLEYE